MRNYYSYELAVYITAEIEINSDVISWEGRDDGYALLPFEIYENYNLPWELVILDSSFLNQCYLVVRRDTYFYPIINLIKDWYYINKFIRFLSIRLLHYFCSIGIAKSKPYCYYSWYSDFFFYNFKRLLSFNL